MFPLDGIRVLDITEAHVGPYATVLMADLGADVIKVERPGGDRVRLRGLRIDRKGIPSQFAALNRNKRSVVLDLQKNKGREVALQLAERSDVFVQNMRPGVIDRLGLGYDEVSKRSPKIIYASASAWGLNGPDAGKPAFDLTGQARGGVMTQTGSEENPIPCGPAVADHLTGLYLFSAIVTALLARERTGVAQHVDSSMTGSLVGLQCREITHYLVNGPPILSWRKLFGAIWSPFETKDIWICINVIPELRWPIFCEVMGLEHLIDDPRFATPQARYENDEELIEIFRGAFLKKPGMEWVRELEKADIVVAPVKTLAQVVEDPQVIANEYITEQEYPGHGLVKVAGVPIRFSEMPIKLRRPSPEIGEHTHEILLDLGYTWEEIGQLVSEEVIC